MHNAMKTFFKPLFLTLLFACLTSANLMANHFDFLTGIEDDSLQLVNLYNATDGPNWTISWDLEEPVVNWHGITLNIERTQVTRITLIQNNLSGTFPDLDLPFLERLYLDVNSLSGTIPILDLPMLQELSLSLNNLSGTIPDLDLPLLSNELFV